jgi:hypothetical protein
LFDLLRNLGDASAVPDLENAMSQWSYYATLALAGMPEGQGIPALVRQVQAQDPGFAGTARGDFEYQILAQVAAQYPEAAAALLDQARSGTLGDSTWRAIIAGLAGDQSRFGNVLPAGSAPEKPGLKSYHSVLGNQNYFSTPLLETGSPEQVRQRMALIDQLAAATSQPAALQSLQQARAALAAFISKGG